LLTGVIVGILPWNPAISTRRSDQGRARIMRINWRRVAAAATGLALLAMPGAGQAQDTFPSRPVRIVVPYSPGSVVDVFGRIVAQNMAAQWNGSIVVESKSGANGSIAAEEVARAAPDGYTWLLVTTFFTASPALDPKLRWDPLRDFIPSGRSAGRRISSSCRCRCRCGAWPNTSRWRRRNPAR
jgi:tripartite tricarboxylate transporter family receptor